MNGRQLEENLIGYLLDGLEADEKRDIETLLQRDEQARRRLEQLRHVLTPLGYDRDDGPPTGLVARTVGRVAEYCCQELPRAPLPANRPVPVRSWWRRADVVAAASLLVLTLGLGVPAVVNMRSKQSAASITSCQNNLRVFYEGLQAYRNAHGKFPNVAAQPEPNKVAGIVVPVLLSAGVLPANNSIRCPANGPTAVCPLTLDQLRALPGDEFLKKATTLLPCYAYSLGYRDAAGNYQGPTATDEQPDSLLPIMADTVQDGPVSRNHGGTGQNVLFADGHVRFATSPNVGFRGDDIYRNKAGQVAAGLDCHDTVLGASASRP